MSLDRTESKVAIIRRLALDLGLPNIECFKADSTQLVSFYFLFSFVFWVIVDTWYFMEVILKYMCVYMFNFMGVYSYVYKYVYTHGEMSIRTNTCVYAYYWVSTHKKITCVYALLVLVGLYCEMCIRTNMCVCAYYWISRHVEYLYRHVEYLYKSCMCVDAYYWISRQVEYLSRHVEYLYKSSVHAFSTLWIEFIHKLQRTLQHALQHTPQHALQHTLQHTLYPVNTVMGWLWLVGSIKL